MARTHHSDERILRAVRDLLLEHGPRGVTVAAVGARSGAPTGSLYHRFGSMAEMVAELWLRVVGGVQAGVAAAVAAAPPGMPRAMATVDALVDFAARRPEDARLLLTVDRAGLDATPGLPEGMARSLRALDGPVEALARRLARELYGRAAPAALDRVHIGVFGVPSTSIRRALLRGSDPRPMGPLLREAAAAVLDAGYRSAAHVRCGARG